MKERLVTALLLIIVIVVLAALSAATYSQKDKTPDSEASPNRSSFNPGPTGTQAFYSLLSETGRHVTRWQQPPGTLLTAKEKDRPAVFVIVGSTRRPFEKGEADDVLAWTAAGGRLVLIDREPDPDLLKTSAQWRMALKSTDDPEILTVDPFDQSGMTRDTPAVKPVQPSVLTSGVNAIQISRFAGSVDIVRDAVDGQEPDKPRYRRRSMPGAPPPADHAPIVSVASQYANILIDAPYGEGRIVVLTDPYVIANGGIRIADNARLAVNLVATSNGIVAFDEYHQGYGTNSNRFLEFFAGTPVVAIFFQGVLIVGFLFYSQSRRFGRPLPDDEPDRLSKLEYVSAMAELQQRTKAYDLALENIYMDFRRRVSRALGLDALTVKSGEMASAIAGSITADANTVRATLFKCEEIIRGEPTNKREVTRLAGELRDTERRLGLSRGERKGR